MERIFIALTNLSSGLSYWVIFGILVACGLGFPMPEDIPLVASGLLVYYETMDLYLALAVTLGGVLIGDAVLFFLGKKMGLRILQNRRVQNIIKPEKVRRTRAYFRKYGDKIVFFARFVAGFRAAAFFMAGAMKMRFRKFLILDALAALLSVPLWIGLGYALGYYFGDEISQILKYFKDVKNAVTILISVVVVAFIINFFIRVRKSQKKLVKPKRKPKHKGA